MNGAKSGQNNSRTDTSSTLVAATAFVTASCRAEGRVALGDGFGGECRNACTLGVRDGLRASLTQVENLKNKIVTTVIANETVRLTRRHARTGPSITLKGMLIAEMT